MKQRLVEVTLPPRRSRHNKLQVNMTGWSREEVLKYELDRDEAIRYNDRVKVAAGPTVMKGKLQGGAEPGWWKEAR